MDPGSHVGFQIGTNDTNLVEDYPMNIFGKLSSILFSGFREEDLNVKSERTDNGRLANDKSSHCLWPGELISRNESAT